MLSTPVLLLVGAVAISLVSAAMRVLAPGAHGAEAQALPSHAVDHRYRREVSELVPPAPRRRLA